MAAPGVAAKYGAITAYGPFYRVANERTQTPDTMHEIVESGELWGQGPLNSDIPAVKAYFGPLPRDRPGFEFFCAAEPDVRGGSTAYWRAREDKAVWLEDEWAKVRILITRVSQPF
jgi:hypothetical protein